MDKYATGQQKAGTSLEYDEVVELLDLVYRQMRYMFKYSANGMRLIEKLMAQIKASSKTP